MSHPRPAGEAAPPGHLQMNLRSARVPVTTGTISQPGFLLTRLGPVPALGDQAPRIGGMPGAPHSRQPLPGRSPRPVTVVEAAVARVP
jgi:hypothetical protein